MDFILKTYKGFFDVIHLEVETDPTKFYAITLWHDKMDTEKYTKENFPQDPSDAGAFLTAPIIVKHCMVDETITMKFTAVAA